MTMNKTILFAGIIAAMILPFSGMNYAYADLTESQKLGLIQEVRELELKIDSARNDTMKMVYEYKLQSVIQKLFEGVDRADAEFTVGEPDEVITSTASGGTITVDGVYTGCNGSGVNWNFAAQTYSTSTWWNVSHYFPNAVSVGTSPNCTGANWDNNLYVESVEIIGEKGCHANLTVGAISQYWLNCEHIMNGLVVSEIKADYDGYPQEITGYHYQWI